MDELRYELIHPDDSRGTLKFIILMKDVAGSSETSVYFAGLYGVTSQTTAMFNSILV